MLAFFVVLQVFVALFLILVVLLQPGNRRGIGGALGLGGGGGDTVFGARGANTFLAKLTMVAAVLFMVSNLSISLMSTQKSDVVKFLEKDTGAAGVAEDLVPDRVETDKNVKAATTKTPIKNDESPKK